MSRPVNQIWSAAPSTIAIGQTSEYIKNLQGLVHNQEELAKHGYILQPLSQAELEGHKRCGGCNKRTLSKSSFLKFLQILALRSRGSQAIISDGRC
jgi:hypothetical protein